MAKAVINVYVLLTIFLLALTADTDCFARQSVKLSSCKDSFMLRGKIRLDSLTKYVHRISGLRFSFNSSKVNGATAIIFPGGLYSFPALLERIRKTTSLYYTFYKGYVIFQDNPPEQYPGSSLAKKESRSTPPQKKERKMFRENKEKISRVMNKPLVAHQHQAGVAHGIRPSHLQDPVSYSDSGYHLLKYDIPALGELSLLKPTPEKRMFTALDFQQTPVDEGEPPLKDAPPPADKQRDSLSKRDRAIKTASRNIAGSFPFQFGLQWQLPLPLQGTAHYFTGTNGKSQPYAVAIPGLWISKPVGPHSSVMAQFQPGQPFFTGNKVVAVFTGFASPNDTVAVRRTTAVSKTSGFTGGLQYNYHFNSQWMLGAGIQYTWQNKALLQEQTIRLADGHLLTDSSFGTKRGSAGWQYIQSSFMATHLEGGYSVRKIQLGITLLVPVSGLTEPSSRAFHGRLFLRWRIQ